MKIKWLSLLLRTDGAAKKKVEVKTELPEESAPQCTDAPQYAEKIFAAPATAGLVPMEQARELPTVGLRGPGGRVEIGTRGGGHRRPVSWVHEVLEDWRNWRQR